MKSHRCLDLGGLAAALLLTAHGGLARPGESSAPTMATVAAKPARLNLVRGRSGLLRLQLRVAPGYHVNANPADEGLIPTTVRMSPANGLVFGKPRFPVARKRTFPFSERPIAVYDGTVEILVPVTVSATARGGKVRGAVRYQACSERSCFSPVMAPFEAAVSVS